MSIKITPDKYPQIIEVYNTEGKTAAYDLMRSCYEIKNPTCVMKRMKADKSLGYNYDTDRFESDSHKPEFTILPLLIYSVSSLTTSSKSVMSLRPLTCHIPVIPGLIAIRAL